MKKKYIVLLALNLATQVRFGVLFLARLNYESFICAGDITFFMCQIGVSIKKVVHILGTLLGLPSDQGLTQRLCDFRSRRATSAWHREESLSWERTRRTMDATFLACGVAGIPSARQIGASLTMAARHEPCLDSA